MKFLVLGWYGHRNIGDDSYEITLPSLFPEHDFKFVDKIENTNDCDAIILGGGNVMKSYFLSQLIGVNDIPIFGLSVGVEEDFTEPVKFKHIWAREQFSVDMLNKKGIPSSLVPDLGLLLKGDKHIGKQWLKKVFAQEDLDLYEKVIVVALNGHLVHGSPGAPVSHAMHFLNFSYKIARIIDETPASFVFLPFGTTTLYDDRVASAWVSSKCKFWKKNYVVYNRLSVRETLDIVSASDLVISSRLHSTIFSYSCGVPFVDITHHSKNWNFLELIGKRQSSLSYWDFDSESMNNKITQGLKAPRSEEVEKCRELIRKELNAVCFN